jgi:hypothetical protein
MKVAATTTHVGNVIIADFSKERSVQTMADVNKVSPDLLEGWASDLLEEEESTGEDALDREWVNIEDCPQIRERWN